MKYTDLTPEEKKFICNGMGRKGWQGILLNWLNRWFEEDANEHDFDYWRGGNESDRIKADNNFLDRLIASATYKDKTISNRKRNVISRFLLLRAAYRIHHAVYEMGDDPKLGGFNYRTKPKTHKKLLQEMQA